MPEYLLSRLGGPYVESMMMMKKINTPIQITMKMKMRMNIKILMLMVMAWLLLLLWWWWWWWWLLLLLLLLLVSLCHVSSELLVDQTLLKSGSF